MGVEVLHKGAGGTAGVSHDRSTQQEQITGHISTPIPAETHHASTGAHDHRHGSLSSLDNLIAVSALDTVVTPPSGSPKELRTPVPPRHTMQPGIELRGSNFALWRENAEAREEGLPLYRNRASVEKALQHGDLVRVVESDGLRINPSIPEWRRCLTPAAANFLYETASTFSQQFPGSFIEITSLTRPLTVQAHEKRAGNPNAAATRGDFASTHMRGSSFDVHWRNLPDPQLLWLANHLFDKEREGRIQVSQEFVKACFHVMAFDPAAAQRQRSLQVAEK